VVYVARYFMICVIMEMMSEVQCDSSTLPMVVAVVCRLIKVSWSMQKSGKIQSIDV